MGFNFSGQKDSHSIRIAGLLEVSRNLFHEHDPLGVVLSSFEDFKQVFELRLLLRVSYEKVVILGAASSYRQNKP